MDAVAAKSTSAEQPEEGRLAPNSEVRLVASGRCTDPYVGRVLKGTYRIRRLIAEGGMGAVYEGEHLRTHRRVAVKLLLEEHSDNPAIAKRFLREPKIVARVEHPHIVQILDFDEVDGDPFFVMEYLDGESVAERLRRSGPLPILDAIRIVSDVASALTQVHANGVVHCDLTPGNLFLVCVNGETDFTKLVDFGASHEVAEHPAASQRLVLGTPNYMAPEQTDRNATIDHRVDQFALAAIVYELLSGRKAFSGCTVTEVVEQVVGSEPVPVSLAAPWLPSVFDDVLKRALSKDPRNRYPSVAAFAWALGNAALEAGFEQRAHARRVSASRYSFTSGVDNDPGSAAWQASCLSEPPTVVEGMRRSSRPAAPLTVALAPDGLAEEPDALFAEARRHFFEQSLDEAVAIAERLLETAVTDEVPSFFFNDASRVRMLDAIFTARLGDPNGFVEQGPAIDRLRYTLSPQASRLVAETEQPIAISALLENARMSHRDGVRLMAVLLQRGVLQPLRSARSIETDLTVHSP